MKTLRSSTTWKFFSGDRGGFLSDHVLLLGRTEVCFFKYQNKLVNPGLISSLHHNKSMMMIAPINSSSSSSSSAHSSLTLESQAELEAAETQTQEIHQSETVHVKLQLQKECLFGEKFLIVGDDPMFGLWDPSDAIPLDWSEEHIWTVELDIPIGRTIEFKFLLKGKTGNILWQPGPDRILRTWETKNTITVLEDWENAEFQKIMEEGPIQTENGASIVNSVYENLTLPKEEHMDVVNKTSEKTSMEANKEPLVAQNITQSPMPMVAENITYPKENNDTTIAENIVGNNGKAAALSNLAISQNEEILENYVGGPVLVPGLTPLDTSQTEEAPSSQDDRSITMDNSVGPDEAKNWKASELNENQEPDSNLHQEIVKQMFKQEELHSSELQQNPDIARVKKQLWSDMHWGRKTLQKLLSNLGFV